MQVLAPAVCALAFIATNSIAHATDAPIVLPAQGGPIRITPIFHGSLQIEYRGTVIHVDPFSQGDYSKAKKANYILITHTHPDHLDAKAILKVVGKSADLIGPELVVDVITSSKTPPFKLTGSVALKNGDFFNLVVKGQASSFSIQAVPMYNLKRGPKPGQKFHPKGDFNGYVLTMGGKRIYIAGDTEATPEMKALKNIDIAFIPMNLPYTMTPQEAATGARAFKPKVVYPYHYRFPFDKANSNPQQFQAALKGSGIEVRLRGWYAHPAKK